MTETKSPIEITLRDYFIAHDADAKRIIDYIYQGLAELEVDAMTEALK